MHNMGKYNSYIIKSLRVVVYSRSGLNRVWQYFSLITSQGLKTKNRNVFLQK